MRTYVSHLKISKTPIGDKSEFSKNISKDNIKMKKKFIQFFQDKSLDKKKAPAGSRRAKKREVFEKHRQGGHKKGPRKRDGKNGHGWSLSIGLVKIL